MSHGDIRSRRNASPGGISRALRLVNELLSGRELTADDAAALLGVTRPTADRQLRRIVETTSWAEPVPNSRPLRARAKQALALEQPTREIAIAACLGSSLAGVFSGSRYESGMREAAHNYVVAASHHRAVFTHIERKFVFLARGGELVLPERAGELDDLIEAVLYSRAAAFNYCHFGGRTERERIKPLSIAVYDHQLYVIGQSDTGVLHPYRFARITDVSVEKTSFTYPSMAQYDPVQFFRDSLGVFVGEDFPVADVEVKLSNKWRTYADTHRWHPSQDTDRRPDHVVIRLRVRLCPELEAWVLGFGEHAEVLKPQRLRVRVAARARALARTYAAPVRSRRC
jgi:predicted DNA-binding transcriptional regulator YafY